MKTGPNIETQFMKGTAVSYAMKVHIKWRVVAAALGALVLFAVTYKVLFHSDPCDEDYHRSAAAASLNDYCNPPHFPAAGHEGDVPSAFEKADGYALASIHVVIRHGDRTAIHSLPNTLRQSIDCRIRSDLVESVNGMDNFREMMSDLGRRAFTKRNPYQNYTKFPDSDSCERSVLTPTGVAQHVRNGLFLRERYSRHKLLDPTRLADTVLVRGTNYSRTFQSSVAFLSGLLPAFDIGELNFEMADNNTMCAGQTRHQCWCPAVTDLLSVFSCTFRQELSKIKTDPESRELYARVNGIYRRIAEKLGVLEEHLPKLSHIFDVGITHFCHNKRLLTTSGGCLELQIIRDLYDAVNEVGRQAAKDKDFDRIARLKMQPLMFEIAHRMKEQASGKLPLKLVVYSGHDSTVDPLASALGIASGIWPKYASRIVFELYTRGDEHFLRVLWDGTVVTSNLRFCRGRMSDADLGLCKLDYFLDFVNRKNLANISESDYALACQKLIMF